MAHTPMHGVYMIGERRMGSSGLAGWYWWMAGGVAANVGDSPFLIRRGRAIRRRAPCLAPQALPFWTLASGCQAQADPPPVPPPRAASLSDPDVNPPGRPAALSASPSRQQPPAGRAR